jgi:hypothetical protein
MIRGVKKFGKNNFLHYFCKMKKYLHGAKEVVFYCKDNSLWEEIYDCLRKEGFPFPEVDKDFNKERFIEIQHHLGKITIKFI